METLFLDDPVYVQERFHELEIEQQQRRVRSLPENDGVASSEDDVDDTRFLQHVHALDTVWPMTVLDKKIAVMRATLSELSEIALNKLDEDEHPHDPYDCVKISKTRAVESPSKRRITSNPAIDESQTPLPLSDLPAATQLGLKLFFRMCHSLRDRSRLSSNIRTLLLVASTIPTILATLPPFALSPGVTMDAQDVTVDMSEPSVMSVFQELLDTLSLILTISTEQDDVPNEQRIHLNESERAIVTTAFVALSLKWGRLRDVLHSVLLIQQYPTLLNTTHMDVLHSTLMELSQTNATVATITLAEEESECGYLLSFGKGDHGKLGHGQCSHVSCAEGNCTENKNTPTLVESTRTSQFVKIDSLSTHSVAITTKGDVMAWGNGDKYRLGHGTAGKEYAPRIIDSLSLKGKVQDVACGLGHTLALMVSGELYAWGNGSNGRLGLGDCNDQALPTKVKLPSTDGQTDSSTLPISLRHIYCGASHSLAISCDGRAFAWGKNNQGQCGHGHTNDQLTVAEISYFRVEMEERVVHAAGGWEHTLFCTSDGRVYSCGSGYKDSRRTVIPPVLGHNDCERRIKPTVIQSLVDTNEEIVKVACGWDHSLAVSAQGSLYTWGSGANGKLGHGDEENCEVPTLVRALAGEKYVKDAKAGCEHTVALTDQHEIWTFGQGDSGRLGHGDSSTRKSPTLVESFAQLGLRPVAIAVGDKYNLVLAEEFNSSLHSEEQINCGSPQHRQRRAKLQTDHHGGLVHSRRLSTLRDEMKSKTFDTRMKASTNQLSNVETVEIESTSTPPAEPTEMGVFIITHIARIALGYGTDVELLNGNESVTLRPYGVDTSRLTFVAIAELLQSQWNTSQNEMCCANTHQRLMFILACLRILCTNLRFRQSRTQVIGRKAFNPDVEYEVSFQQLRHIVYTLSGSTTDEILCGCGSELKIQHADEHLAQAVSNEAASALRIGFAHFYPEATDRRALLWELVHSSNGGELAGSTPRQAVLVEKLCEDENMSEIVLYFLTKSNTLLKRSHTCGVNSAIQDNSTDTMLGANRSSDDHSDSMQLLVLMKSLLDHCSSDAINRLDQVHPFRPSDSSIKLLTVVQGHCFSAATQHMSTTNICGCVMDVLVMYLESLVFSALQVTRRLHKASCQHEEVITERLSGSFLDQLLTSAMEAVCILVTMTTMKQLDPVNVNDGHEPPIFTLIAKLVPLILPLIKLLDELKWKISTDTAGEDNQHHENPYPHSWVDCLGDSLAMVAGRFAGVLLQRRQENENTQRKTFGNCLDQIARNYMCTSVRAVCAWEQTGILDDGEHVHIADTSINVDNNVDRNNEGLAHEESNLARQYIEDELFRVGVNMFHDLLRKVTSSSMKCSLVTELSKALIPSSSTLPRCFRRLGTNERQAEGIIRSLENLFMHLVHVISDKSGTSTMSKTKAALMWLWFVHSSVLDGSVISAIVVKTGVLTALSEVFVKDSSSVLTSITQLGDEGNLLYYSHPLHASVGYENINRPASHPLSSKLRAVEVMLLGHTPDQHLGKVAFHVLSDISIHVSTSLPELMEPNERVHPLLASHTPTTCANEFLNHTIVSPRRRLTLPKKLVVSSVTETMEVVYEGLYQLLNKLISEHIALGQSIFPITLHTSQNDSNKENTSEKIVDNLTPQTLFLVGTPLVISPARTQPVKQIKASSSQWRLSTQLGHQDSSKVPQTWTVSWWLHVSAPIHRSDSTGSNETDGIVQSILAFGQPQDKSGTMTDAQDAGTGTYVESSGRWELIVYGRRVKGQDELTLGFAISVMGNKIRWMTYEFGTLPRSGWIHLAIVMDMSTACPQVCIDGVPVSCHVVGSSPSNPIHSCIHLRFPRLSCGGTLDTQLQTDLGLLDAGATLNKPSSIKDASIIADMIVDDVWVFNRALKQDACLKLFKQGPTLYQIRRHYQVATQTSSILALLCQLLRASKSAMTTSTATSTRWTTLLMELLLLCRSNQSAQLCVLELLGQMLPHLPDLASSKLLDELIQDVFDGCETHRMVTRVPMDQGRIYASLHTPQAISTSAVEYVPHPVFTLLRERGLICSLSPFNASFTSKVGNGVIVAGTIKVLQNLVNVSAWSPVVRQWIVDAYSIYTNSKQDGNGPTKVIGILVAASTLLSGYSEQFMNKSRLELVQTLTVGQEQLKAILPIECSYGSALQRLSSTAEWIHSLVISMLEHDSLRLPSLQLQGRDEQLQTEGESIDIEALDHLAAMEMRIQTSLLRFLMVNIINNDNDIGFTQDWYGHLLDGSYQKLLEELITWASTSPVELVMNRLGSSAKRALRQRSTRQFLKELFPQRSSAARALIQEVEELEAEAWEYYRTQHEGAQRINAKTLWWQHPTATIPLSRLEVLGGEVEIHDLAVRAIQHFPTIRLGHVAICANTGLWYYEVRLLSDGLMQIGYIDGEFVSDPVQGQGVGDHTNSWAFDGFRRKKWNVNANEYGETWHIGDVVGVLLDTDRMELSYFLNGKFLGVAFSSLPMTASSVMYPAVSLNADQAAQFNFGTWPLTVNEGIEMNQMMAKSFLYLPLLVSEQEQIRLHPVASAVSTMITNNNVQDGLENASESSENESVLELEITGKSEPEVLSTDGNTIHPRWTTWGTDGERPTVSRETHVHDADKHELIESLTALGFPREWASRCANETTFTISDSGAVGWILEQMEREALASVSTMAHHDDDSHEDTTRNDRVVTNMSVLHSFDDLSIRSQANTLTPTTIWNRPTRTNRPHTEQQHTRTRPSNINVEVETTGKNNTGGNLSKQNPFLADDLNDSTMEQNTDYYTATSSAIHRMYTNESDHHVQTRLMKRLDKKGDETTRPSDTSVLRSLKWDSVDDDVLPLCVVLDTTLTISYCRKILYALLCSNVPTESKLYETLKLWIGKDKDISFLVFLKRLLMLDSRNMTVEIEECDTACSAIAKTLERLLAYEHQSTFGQERPLFLSMFEEVRLHLAQMAQLMVTTRLKPLKASLLTQSRSARWTLWLTTILYRHGTCIDASTLSQTLLSSSLMQDTMILASASDTIGGPWKYIAFTILNSRLCAPDSNLLRMSDLVEVLGHRCKREQSKQLAYSEITKLIWSLLVRSFPPRIIQEYGDQKSNRLHLRVESLSTTCVKISWELLPLPSSTVLMNVPDDENTDTTTTNDPPLEPSRITSESDTLILNVTRANGLMTIPSCTLPSVGTHMIRNLTPDTIYILKLSETSSNESCMTELELVTRREPMFEFDPEASGKNLYVCNHHLTVKNQVNKKWHTIRGAIAFEQGIHTWQVRIDACVSKNIFIGICTADASLENYIGSDAYGYGFLANKAVWHNKSKLQSYGEIFKQGDVIQVTLDCMHRTLSYSRNGESLGIAATNIPLINEKDGTECQWYPAVSLYNKDDQLTLIPPRANVESTSPQSQHASICRQVESAQLMQEYLQLSSIPMFEQQLLAEVKASWPKWSQNKLIWRESELGEMIKLDASDEATSIFGISTGDIVLTTKGQCVVLGVYNHELWYEISEETLVEREIVRIGSWSLHTCRQLLASPNDYPIHKTASDFDDSDENVSRNVPVIPYPFEDGSLKSLKMDQMLIALLEALAATRGIDPYRLTRSELSTLYVLYDLESSLSSIATREHGPDGCQQDDFLARMCYLLHLNQHAYHTARYLIQQCDVLVSSHHLELALPTTPAPLDIDPRLRTRSEQVILQSSIRCNIDNEERTSLTLQYVFSCQRERMIQEALHRTMTPTLSELSMDLSNSSDLINEPKELPRLEFQPPVHKARPYWEHLPSRTTCCTLPSRARRESSLFGQLSRQLAIVDPTDMRREYTSPHDVMSITRTFNIQLGTIDPSIDSFASSILDPLMQYLQFWDSVVREIQSPSFPLFVPTNAAARDIQLDINLHLFSPEVQVSCGIEKHEVLLWYFQVGQLLGIAWRSKIILPLQSISSNFWEDLLCPSTFTLANDFRRQTIRTIRLGLCTIVPSECLQISTLDSLCNRLSETDRTQVQQIQHHAIYDVKCAHHELLWTVLSEMTCLERRLVIQFLTGKTKHLDPIEEWKQHVAQTNPPSNKAFVLEIVEALTDDQVDQDESVPVVEVVDRWSSRVHLPSYSDSGILRKQLILAATSRI